MIEIPSLPAPSLPRIRRQSEGSANMPLLLLTYSMSLNTHSTLGTRSRLLAYPSECRHRLISLRPFVGQRFDILLAEARDGRSPELVDGDGVLHGVQIDAGIVPCRPFAPVSQCRLHLPRDDGDDLEQKGDLCVPQEGETSR